MLQEKSCKNLSNAIHRAFARLAFEEYRGKLFFIDDDRSPMHDPETMSFPNPDRSQENYEDDYSPAYVPSGGYTRGDASPNRSGSHSNSHQRQPSVHNSVIDVSSRPQGHTSSNNAHPSVMNESIGIGLQQDPSRIAQKQDISRAGQLGSTIKNTTIANRNDGGADYEGTMFRSGLFEKKATTHSQAKSKTHSDISRNIGRSAFRPELPQASAFMQMPMQMPMIKPDPMEEEVPLDFVRIGDIVCLQFEKKVFNNIKEYAQRDKVIDEDNINFAKIIEKPDYIYKGIIFSDGIVSKDIRLGSEKHKETIANYNKSIFRIEIIQDYKHSQEYHELTVELATAEEGDYENPEEENEKIIIQNDLKKKFLKEKRSNTSEQKYKTGSKLVYGQTIQFRHISSDLYLTLDSSKLAPEYGSYELVLSPSSKASKFQIMPTKMKSKQINEPITYEDYFIIKNINGKDEYFLHCDPSELEININEERDKLILPISASHGISSSSDWRFTKYLSSKKDIKEKEKRKDVLTTMDTIRLYHKDSGGYLTVTRKDVESVLPEFPDYLKKEVNILSEEKDDLEDEEDDELIVYEEKQKQELSVFVERDSSKLDKTNTLWEIQKIGKLVCETLHTNESYLFKHVATGFYLTLGENVDLTLTQTGTQAENEFKFRNEKLFKTLKSEISNKELVCVLNLENKFNQTYVSTEEEEFNYYNSRNRKTGVQVVCAYKHTKEIIKEGFIIEKADKELTKFAHKGYSIFKYLLDTYSFLNDWGVINEYDEDVAYKKYDPLEAATTEDKLSDKTTEVSEILDLIIYDLKNKGRDEIFRIQSYYSEQGTLEMLIKLAELILYKSTTIEERALDLVGQSELRQQAVKNLNNEEIGDNEMKAEFVADEHLSELNKKILHVIFLMCQYHPNNCNIITKYDEILYRINEAEDDNDIKSFKPTICKILTEAFKRANHIHNDKAAIMEYKDALDYEAVSSRLVAGVAATSDKTLKNQLVKWLDMLDIITFDSHVESNIYQQILYVKILSMFCIKSSRSAYYIDEKQQSNALKGDKKYQILCGKLLFSSEKHIPLKFGYEHRATEIPYVTFQRRSGKRSDLFLDRNPILEELFRSDAGNENQDNTFTFEEITNHEDVLMPYIDYI